MDTRTGCEVLKPDFPPNLCPTQCPHLDPVHLHRRNTCLKKTPSCQFKWYELRRDPLESRQNYKLMFWRVITLVMQ